MSEIRQISQVGNAPCVFLKKSILEFLGLSVGDTVIVDYDGSGITIKKAYGVKKTYNPRIIRVNKKDL